MPYCRQHQHAYLGQCDSCVAQALAEEEQRTHRVEETARNMRRRYGSWERAREWADMHRCSYDRNEYGYLLWNDVVAAIDDLSRKEP